MKIVLAYSGGLDTSVLMSWIKEKYNAEMIRLASAPTSGRKRNSTASKPKALKTGNVENLH